MGDQDTKKESEMRVFCAHDKMFKLEALIPSPRNPNKHTPEQITLLAKIMRLSGVRKPITVSNRSGFITIGHARMQAALENGWTEYPIDLQDYKNEAEEYADMVADNKIAELATSDMGMIEEDAKRLKEEIADFDIFGIPDFKLSEVDGNYVVPEEKEFTDDSQLLVVTECQSETEQADLFEELSKRGLKCKVM